MPRPPHPGNRSNRTWLSHPAALSVGDRAGLMAIFVGSTTAALGGLTLGLTMFTTGLDVINAMPDDRPVETLPEDVYAGLLVALAVLAVLLIVLGVGLVVCGRLLRRRAGGGKAVAWWALGLTAGVALLLPLLLVGTAGNPLAGLVLFAGPAVALGLLGSLLWQATRLLPGARPGELIEPLAGVVGFTFVPADPRELPPVPAPASDTSPRAATSDAAADVPLHADADRHDG